MAVHADCAPGGDMDRLRDESSKAEPHFTVGGVRFAVVVEPPDEPRLSCDDSHLETMVHLFNQAAVGALGDPCLLAELVRAGKPARFPLGGVVPVSEADVDGFLWRDPGELALCRLDVSWAGAPPMVYASTGRVAHVFERFMALRRAALLRWIFRRMPTWCTPAPGEEAAVRALDAEAPALLGSEPPRTPGAAYSAWLARFESWLAAVRDFGLTETSGLLPFKSDFLVRWSCARLAAWYGAAAARDDWSQQRHRIGPLPSDYTSRLTALSLSYFLEGAKLSPASLAALEHAVQRLEDSSPCGTLDAVGWRVFWRRELGRPMLVSVT